jgi:hypothetical protein
VAEVRSSSGEARSAVPEKPPPFALFRTTAQGRKAATPSRLGSPGDKGPPSALPSVDLKVRIQPGHMWLTREGGH